MLFLVVFCSMMCLCLKLDDTVWSHFTHRCWDGTAINLCNTNRKLESPLRRKKTQTKHSWPHCWPCIRTHKHTHMHRNTGAHTHTHTQTHTHTLPTGHKWAFSDLLSQSVHLTNNFFVKRYSQYWLIIWSVKCENTNTVHTKFTHIYIPNFCNLGISPNHTVILLIYLKITL